MAAFGRWKETVNLMDMTSIPLPFVFKHIYKNIPSAIADRLGKLMIAYHILYGKTFNEYRLVFADKLAACLMEKILPLIGYSFMLPCKSIDRFAPIIRPPGFPGCKPLKPFRFQMCPFKMEEIIT